jgi:ankyrin repeat protein
VNDENTSPLHYIIRSQYSEELIEVLDLMLEKGVDLECRNKYNETPLIQASAKGASSVLDVCCDCLHSA